MASVTRAADQQTANLVAATPNSLTFETAKCQQLSVTIENTGANAIGTTVVSESSDGAIYGTNDAAGVAIGSIASSASKQLSFDRIAFVRLKFTFTSTSGSSVRVTLRGT